MMTTKQGDYIMTTTKNTAEKIEGIISFLVKRLKETEDKGRQVALVEMIEVLRGRLELLTMIDVQYLVNKANEGDERSKRLLIQRYGKVITAELLEET